MHENSLPTGDRDHHENEVPLAIAADPKLQQERRIISQKSIWLNAELHGWHSPPCSLETDLLLIHSEISEACEALRKGLLFFENDKDSVEEELADAVIRIFHTAEKNGFDICEAVCRKHQKNISRPYRHGNKKF